MTILNATVFPAEAYVLVQTDWAETDFRQSFSVDSASNWPTADTGQTFTVQSGAAGDFTSSVGKGFTTHAATNTIKRISANTLSLLDFDSTGVFTNVTVPTGGDFEFGVGGRFVDNNNRVETRIFLTVAGTASFSIRQLIAGVETNGGFPALTGFPVSGVFRWRFRGIGSQLFFRIWLASTPEPMTWNGTFTTTWLTAGSASWMSNVAAAVTNPLPISFTWDDLVVVDPNNVCPAYAGVRRTNTVTGEVVNLRPYIAFDANGNLLLECCEGLWWDTEPPLNVPLEYCAVSADLPATITVNPDFDTSVAGWTVFGGGALTQDCAVAKVGTCSARITPNGTGADPGIQQTGLVLAAGRQTTFSGWARSTLGWNSVLLRLAVTYIDLTTATFETPAVTLDDNEWRFLSFTFTPAQTITSFTFSFRAAGIPANTNLFNLDDLKVTQLAAGPTGDCETVTVSSESVWLKSPLHPCDDIEIGLCSPMLEDCEDDTRVSYVGTFDDSYAPNTVVLSPVNRRRPIPINRVRRDAAATLRILAHDCDARDAVLQANAPGDPLLFQAPATYCIPDRYITVDVESETRISVDQREDFRLMTLPYVVVDRPEGPADGPCGTRIQDLCDIYSSWGALAIAGLTWEDLLLGEASPNGPGQPAPAADARTWGDVESEFANWLAVEAGGTRDWGELRDGL